MRGMDEHGVRGRRPWRGRRREAGGRRGGGPGYPLPDREPHGYDPDWSEYRQEERGYGRGFRGRPRRPPTFPWRRGRPGWRQWGERPRRGAGRGPGGRPYRERWWGAIGPERREDYDWGYHAREPERYGWTGEVGRH
ncbi:MAG TPA: hypothetical protein VF188_17205 [Longimicrobiales bacterium]